VNSPPLHRQRQAMADIETAVGPGTKEEGYIQKRALSQRAAYGRGQGLLRSIVFVSSSPFLAMAKDKDDLFWHWHWFFPPGAGCSRVAATTFIYGDCWAWARWLLIYRAVALGA
jgi:hypothetical protein